MTERKTNEDWKKVVHSNAEDIAKYYSCFGVAAAKRGGMRSEGCLPANQNTSGNLFFMSLELRVVRTTDRTYPQLTRLSAQALRPPH